MHEVSGPVDWTANAALKFSSCCSDSHPADHGGGQRRVQEAIPPHAAVLVSGDGQRQQELVGEAVSAGGPVHVDSPGGGRGLLGDQGEHSLSARLK